MGIICAHCWVLTWCLFGNNKDKQVCCSLTIKLKFGQGWDAVVTRQGRGNLFHHQSAMKWVIKESLYQLKRCSDTPYQSFITRHITISLPIQTVKNYGDCRNWELCIPAAFWDPKILTAGSLSRPRYNNDRKWTLSSTFFPSKADGDNSEVVL